MIKREAVVGYFVQNNEVLLLLTNYGKGKEVWNGVSGFLDENEEPEHALIREADEELGVSIIPDMLQKKGTETITGILFHFYLVNEWQGNPTPTEESIKEIRWFAKEDLPYEKMYEGDSERLPRLLNLK